MTTRTYSNLVDVDRFVCIHGHFYQPPRENAWLERIERQESAYPFRDWNERIDSECYRPNAKARILDDEDRIVTLANNYARINFNFGPTLLSWMERRAEGTYEGVLAADAESKRRFGHGSAMAQAYGHIILPLASERDRRTQVRWGIRDFERRFGRKPEGMWLPETAVCTDSLLAMAEQGIQFTVLSPRQAKAIIRKGRAEPEEVNEGTLDTRRPYFVDLGAGRRIAVFFYDGATSQAIAFERLLSSGDAFANRLLARFRGGPGPELVHVATDGETYGHHHRFGEMALAYALDRIESSGKARLTNYATFLALHPPEDEAIIVERSSWSCAHGVGRWSADCGCKTRGDSNQAWRGPLRKALDKLRDRIDDLYEEAAAGLLVDPWAARDDYVDVVLDRSEDNVRAFLDRHTKDSSAENRHRALELCELQRQRMLMFTSCGWFFDDVNGIETTQILQYAARAVELGSSVSGVALEAPFLADLEPARATTPGALSARHVYETAVKGAHVDAERLAAAFALITLFGQKATPTEAFEIEEHELRVAKNDGARLAVGRITIKHLVTTRARTFAFAALHRGGPGVEGGTRTLAHVREAEDEAEELITAFEEDRDFEATRARITQRFPHHFHSLRVLPIDDRITVVEKIVAEAVSTAETALRQVFAQNAPLLTELAATAVRPPAVLTAATRVVLEADLNRAARRDPPDTRTMRSLVAEARAENVSFDEKGFSFQLGRAISRTCAALERDPADDSALGRLGDMIEIARKLSATFDLSVPQDLAWSVVREETPLAKQVREKGRLGAWTEIAKTLRIRVG
ncbi:MAG: DUF3536 domain-containing protein [Myxococcales bacterium]|nr:DUF3536 domain-containing protein [Myxococcales bacterium]